MYSRLLRARPAVAHFRLQRGRNGRDPKRLSHVLLSGWACRLALSPIMAFRIVQCEMDGEALGARKIVAGPASTMDDAENLVARVAQSYGEAGYDPQGRYWWARDPLGQEFRFLIELSGLDETDGV